MDHPEDAKPEADVSEQEQAAEPDERSADEPPRDPEAPEADVLEQRAPARHHGDERPNVDRAEADEADLLEQAREAGDDDDDEVR